MLKELYESIHFSSNLPVRVFMSQHGYVKAHWHQSVELLLVLEGRVQATVDGERFILKPEDILLINTNTIHELDSPGSVSMVLQFSPDIFSQSSENMDALSFACNSAVDPSPERYQNLRSLIARLVQNNANVNAGTPYRNNAYYLLIVSELMTCFRCTATDSTKSKRNRASRMTSILEYIEAHYRENFSLSDLAEAQNLSVPYLSSFFNKQMGIGFSQYYTNVKLEHAVYSLTSTEDSIEAVGAANGFPEPHAFVRAFKKKYGCLPSTYRKQHNAAILNRGAIGQTNYIKLEPTNYLHLLKHYLDDSAMPSAPAAPAVTQKTLPVPGVNYRMHGKPLRHTFRTLTSVGRASDLLQEDILKMIRRMQENLHYRYIKFHGLFSDEMMVVTRLPNGGLQFNFTLIDRIIENLKDLDLKPWMQLSFMPTALASDPKKTIFQLPMNTSPPADMEEWISLVRILTVHLIQRFGKEEVVTWPFCVWSEPDTPASMFGWANHSLFWDFYRRTYQTVKSVCPEISFGSPAFLYMRHNADASWIRQFLAFTEKNKCRPDFLSVHYYADMLPSDSVQERVELLPRSRFPEDPNDFHDFIDDIQGIFQECGVGALPVYLAEWNFTFSHRNLINDTVFKSCYIFKNLLENYDRLESFGYWSLTDRIAENPMPDHLFHGGLGLFTVNGIRKPVFHAMRFFNMVGDELLARGEGYFITRKGRRITIFTYHYVHYGSLFAAGEGFDLTQAERYSIFDMTQKLSLSIELNHLPEKKYLRKEYILNREHGSAFDAWLATGAMPLTGYEAEILDGNCDPQLFQAEIVPENGTILYTPTLEPLEVRTTTFTPI